MVLIGLFGSDIRRMAKPTFKLFDIRIGHYCCTQWHGVKFFRITSPNIRKGKFLCFTGYAGAHPELRSCFSARTENPEEQEYDEFWDLCQKRKQEILEDLAFWRDFTKVFVERYGELWLCVYDRRAFSRVRPLIEITLDEWEEDHFLKLEWNQLIVIRKKEWLDEPVDELVRRLMGEQPADGADMEGRRSRA